MTEWLWPRGWHTRIATILTVPLVLLALGSMLSWPGTNNGNDTNAYLVHIIVVTAAVLMISWIGRWLDSRHAAGQPGEAILRLLMPAIAIGIFAAWTIERGIFARSGRAWLPILVFSTFLVGLLRFGLDRVAKLSGSPVTAPSDDQTLHAPSVSLAGPPQWPTEPPMAPAANNAPDGGLAAHEPDAAPNPSDNKGYVHRVTSGIVTAIWLPLGFLVWFAANWCPADGVAGAVMIGSVIFVLIQIGGNAYAGVWLDRRYGSAGGPLLAIGRSLGVAIVLAFVSGVLIMLAVPNGTPRSCN